MKIIRSSIWETNSSMTHSCVIMTAEQDKKWTDEGLYYCNCRRWSSVSELEEPPIHGELYTEDEVLEFYRKAGYEYDESKYEDVSHFIREFDEFILYDEWVNDEYLEKDSETYTTPGGETIVVHCKFGGDY